MGLVLEISLDRDIREIEQFFDDVKFKAVTIAARQALNRTADRTKSFALKEIRRRRKLKLKDAKGFVKVRKARGRDIAKLEARVDFLGIPLPLILFILGQKTPKTQTLPNPQRRSRRFEIAKGDKKAKAGLFVQKAKRGKQRFQVFRRGDKSDVSQGFKKQAAPSIAELLRAKSNILRKIENNAIAILAREYDNALANQLRTIRF